MCMALAALFSIIVAAGMAYKMMVKHEPLDIMKLFRPLAVSIVLCWWYPPADTGITNSGNNWCILDFLSYISYNVITFADKTRNTDGLYPQTMSSLKIVAMKNVYLISMKAYSDVLMSVKKERKEHHTNIFY